MQSLFVCTVPGRYLACLILVLVIFAMGCENKALAEAQKQRQSVVQRSEGVELIGCTDSIGINVDGWVRNTNAYSVRIREVFQSSGERTESIFIVASGKEVAVNIGWQNAFIVYTLDGAMVGIIKGWCPK